MNSNPDWLEQIPQHYRRGLVSALADVSRFVDSDFIIIGALPLLILGIIDYQAVWDIDLLFENQGDVDSFTRKFKYDSMIYDKPMIGSSITTLRAAFKSCGVWFNIDLIVKDQVCYQIFSRSAKIYSNLIEYNGPFQMMLPLADPVSILADKLTSPRLIRDLKQGNSLSIDLRHIFYILNRFQDEEKFYPRLMDDGRSLSQVQLVTDNLAAIIKQKEGFGYCDFKPSPRLLAFLNLCSTA